MALVNRVPQQCEDGGAGNESCSEALSRAEASLQTKWNKRIFLFKFFFFKLSSSVLVCMCICVQCPQQPEEGVRFPPEQGIRSPWSWS